MTSNSVKSDARAFLDAFSSTPLCQIDKLQPDQARSLMARMRDAAPPLVHDLALVQDLQFDTLGHPIKLRMYDKREERGPGPVIIYYHGGGFVFGDLDSHHALCIDIARQMDLPLVAVDYRLAPEHPFPAAVIDAEGAARWICDNAKIELGRHATGIVLAGDSAGGNLAAVTAKALRDSQAAAPVLAQLLMYPCTSLESRTASKAEFADGFFLTAAGMVWFLKHYAPPRSDPRFELEAFDQAGMPPTILITAGLDPLRDEGRAYAAALIQAGVPTTYQEAQGNIHGCFSMCAAIPSAAKELAKGLNALALIVNGEALTQTAAASCSP